MKPRLDGAKYATSKLMQGLRALHPEIQASGLEPALLELVEIRASQINGCAFCLDMHTKNARTLGETEQRIYALNAWRETAFFTPRERAALEWTETLTLVAQTHAPDDVYESVRQHFEETEFVALTFAIATINSWNRVAITFRPVVGAFESPHTAVRATA
jgi:AhpD family alkylhydroperoxidase